MTDEEPQSERGAPGSRDKGDAPGEGSADRPAGTFDESESSGVNPKKPIDDDSPPLQPGDQGG